MVYKFYIKGRTGLEVNLELQNIELYYIWNGLWRMNGME